MQAQVDSKGLKQVYARSGIYTGPEYAQVRIWIRRCAAMCTMPLDLVMMFWDRVMSHIPVTGNPIVDAHLLDFRNYVFNEWLSNQVRRQRWSQWANWEGPRTDNAVEGWNNSLSSKFESAKMGLSEWLVQYQRLHNFQRIRILQLIDGSAPKVRDANVVANDNRFRANKFAFQNVWQGWLNTPPNAPLPFPGQDPAQILDGHILHYLDAQIKCMGKTLRTFEEEENFELA